MNSTRPICAATYPSLVAVLCCVTTQGPACSTVAGCTSPLSSKSCVMPIFFPRIPATFAISFSVPSLASGYWLVSFLLMLFTKRFDLHIHTSGKIELHQRIHGLLRGLENVEQALVGANF